MGDMSDLMITEPYIGEPSCIVCHQPVTPENSEVWWRVNRIWESEGTPPRWVEAYSHHGWCTERVKHRWDADWVHEHPRPETLPAFHYPN